MLQRLFRKKRISAALHESAAVITPSPAIYQAMLAEIMPEAVKEGRVSYAAAREQVDKLTRGRQRMVRGTALGLVFSAAALLLIFWPEGRINFIPEESVPSSQYPIAAQITISCQTVDAGYVHVSVPDSEEVQWESVYALDQKGNPISPYAVYPELNMAIFAPPESDIVIYVPLASGAEGSCVYEIRR